MFQIGPFNFHIYGFILGVAIISCWSLVESIVRRSQIRPTNLTRIMTVTMVMGIIGARLYHVIDYWWYYQLYLNEIFYLWQGGLGIWGAILGGGAGLFLTTWKLPALRWIMLDSITLTLPLGQAIGRLGNYVNHELFGQPTTLPWKLYIPLEYRPSDMESVEYYHPLFAYEAVLNSLLFLFLWVRYAHGIKPGSRTITGYYLVGYGLIRFLLEPLRIHPWTWGLLTVAQWVSLVMITIGVILIFKVGLRRESAKP